MTFRYSTCAVAAIIFSSAFSTTIFATTAAVAQEIAPAPNNVSAAAPAAPVVPPMPANAPAAATGPAPAVTPAAAIAPPSEPVAAPAPPVLRDPSLIQEDVEPSVRVFGTEKIEIRIGGLMQVQFTPYVGNDSLIANGDAATREGFRLRRAGFGIEGQITERLSVLLSVNPIQVSDSDGSLADAKLTYFFSPELRLSIGSGKTPFSRGALESSRTLTTIERPLSVTAIAPSRRLGITAEGRFLGGHIAYLASVMNGTEGFVNGNQNGGIFAGGRVDVSPWQSPDPWERVDGVSVGADAFYDKTPSTKGYAYSADAFAALSGASVKVEALCDDRRPLDAPIVSPDIPDTIRRCGAYVEAGYVLPFAPIQPAARLEVFDDNTALHDAGDVYLIDFGANWQFVKKYARAQLHYLMRRERYVPEISNDSLVLSVQGAF